MMRVLIALALLSIISCSKKNTVPKDILTPDKMQDVLWDLIRADQYTQDLVFRDTTKKTDVQNKIFYSKVFAIHKITPADFQKSYSFYSRHPDLMRIMLDTLLSRKTLEIEAENQVKPGALPLGDSLH